MEKLANQVTVEEIQTCRFYKKLNGRIVHMYDFWNPEILEAGEGVTVFPEDRSTPFALPEPWYFIENCPSYIIVTAPDSFNIDQGETASVKTVQAVAHASGENINLTLTFKHNGYTEYNIAGGLHSEAEAANYINVIAPGTYTHANGTATVAIEQFDIEEEVIFSSGVATLSIPANKILNESFNGTITFENQDYSFTVMGVELSAEVINQKKMDEIREERNLRLEAEDWKIIRHITQQVAEVETTLTAAQFKNLCIYMQALRDLPANIQDVDNVEWPVLDLDAQPEQAQEPGE